MQFIQSKSLESAAEFIAKKITERLDKDQKVLWLLSGGSAIGLAVKAAEIIKENSNLDSLTITLADERYGAVGHKDSNWQQIKQAGLNLPGAKMQPVLTGESMDQTAKDYGKFLDQDLQNSDYSLAIAGIGSDGHTFGIKPNSPSVDSKDLVCAFTWDDFDRITPTAQFIKQLDEVIVYSFGPEKRAQLEALTQDLPISKQPAQALKLVKNLTILNDFKGDKI